MVSADEAISTARTYLGTPFQHQGRLKGVGLDCVGLLICLGKELGLFDSQLEYTGYRRRPDGVLLTELMNLHLGAKPDGDLIKPADVLLIRVRQPQHAVLVTDIRPLTVIHAVARGVVEHRFDERWQRRIMAVYRIPGVTHG